jgi:hypothetical protein
MTTLTAWSATLMDTFAAANWPLYFATHDNTVSFDCRQMSALGH